eukprot:gene61-1745_t
MTRGIKTTMTGYPLQWPAYATAIVAVSLSTIAHDLGRGHHHANVLGNTGGVDERECLAVSQIPDIAITAFDRELDP